MHVRKYKKKWQTIVRRKGHKTKIKSFVSKAEATKWGRSIERNLDTGSPVDYSEASKNTLGDLFKRYIRENKHKAKKQWRNEEYRVGQLLKDTISDINLLRFSTKHLAEFRDRRCDQVKSATYNKDFNFISVVISTAINDWGIYIPHNPCKMMKRETEDKPRKRVLENDEQSRLIEACALSENIYLKPMVQFSIETSVRQGELLKIKYEHINFKKRLVTLYDTKNGEDRTIPLSQKALKRAKIKGLRWHDLRRHAITIMFEEKGLDVPTVQLISGHKNPMVLLNTYTKLNPEKLVSKLG
jgi:integrase